MQVALRTGAGEVDVEVTVHDPAATVADLAGVLAQCGLPGSGSALDEGLAIDGASVPGSAPLRAAGLRSGCAVVLGGAPMTIPDPAAHDVELAVVGGLAGGDRHPLPPGCSRLGRHPAGAVVLRGRTISNRHARVEVRGEDVTLADAGSTSGTWVDGRRITEPEPLDLDAVVALGASLVRIGLPPWREPAVLGPVGADWRRALHRPPPAAPPPEVGAVTPPRSPATAADPPHFAWAAALVPLVAGLVLARLVDPRLALFTLLGPAVLAGQWIEDRRRHGRRGAESGTAQRAGLARFAAAVHTAAGAEAQRRRALHPDPAAVGHEIEALGSKLWSRRPGSSAFAEVTVGAGAALGWAPPTNGEPAGGAVDVLESTRLPPGCPATVSLAGTSHLGVSGPRDAALAVARWVVLQLAAHHGPADLRIAVLCRVERVEAWAWASYLPHVDSPAGPKLLAAGRTDAAEVTEAWRSGAGATLVVVVDGEGLVDGGGPATELATAGATLTIGPARRALPGRCTSVVELDGHDGWGLLTTRAGSAQQILATGIQDGTARRWARRLSALSDPEAVRGARAPAATRLLDLLALDHPTAAAVRERWGRSRQAVTPVGAGGSDLEPVSLDLVADGPHMLVGGTTGSGKSELLRTIVAGLAATSPPERLALLLVDYKGGAAFAEAAALPHVVGLVTDLGAEEAARALHSLEAELRRREGVLAALGVRELADHPAHRPGPPPAGAQALPRLVVVIDELAALVAELPAFLDGLVQLAARGRSLGLHLILATQRPGSVVSAAVRTNCAIRCCLRVPDEADAIEVVGAAGPAHLDRRQPGRAFLRRGAGDLVEIQVALAGGCRPAEPPRVSVQAATFGPTPVVSGVTGGDGPSDLALLVDACRQAADERGSEAPRPLWLPPLPADLPACDLPDGAGDVTLGLVDDPDHQRRLPLTWRPAAGPLVALGSGSGPALALEAVTRGLAAALGPDELHVYGLDLAAQNLAGLAELPHVGAVVRGAEAERTHRLLRRLTDELVSRQAAATAPATAAARPRLLVLIDGVAALRTALDDALGLAALDALERVVVDGPALGISVALTADRLAAVPAAWAGAASCRLAFRGGDHLDLLALGAGRVDRSHWPDGRCIELGRNLVAQVATGRWPAPSPRRSGEPGPAAVAALPSTVRVDDVTAACRPEVNADGLRLPLGVDGRRLDVTVLRLRTGQPFLVCGPPGSGRSTTLAAIAVLAERAGCSVVRPEGTASRPAERGTGHDRRPVVVLVDDADRVADPDGWLADLTSGRHPGVHLVAAVAPDAVRSGFGHWTAGLRRAGTGIVLRPRSELDADVLGVTLLPRWPLSLNLPGRGVLVADGEALPLQVVIP